MYSQFSFASTSSDVTTSSGSSSQDQNAVPMFYDYVDKEGVVHRHEMRFSANHGRPEPVSDSFQEDFGQYFVPSVAYVPPQLTTPPSNSMFGSMDPSMVYSPFPVPAYQFTPSPLGNQASNFKDFKKVTSTKKKTMKATSIQANYVCSNQNCQTRETTLWRRTENGDRECNACCLFFRKNGYARPAEHCAKKIMRRHRRPRTDTCTDPAAPTSSLHKE